MWLETHKPLRGSKWEEYWFVVDNGRLRFYEDPTSRKAMADVTLDDTEIGSCGHPRAGHFAFRLTDLKHHRKYVLAADTEAESLSWGESILEHGASGLFRSLSVKPKSSLSFMSFSRAKTPGAVPTNDSENATLPGSGSFNFKSFGRRKLPQNAQMGPLHAPQVPQAAPAEEGQTEDASRDRRRPRCVQFMEVEEPPKKRLSIDTSLDHSVQE